MAKVPNAVEILPKISTAWVRCTSVTDDRQTIDDRQTDRREFTFAKKDALGVKQNRQTQSGTKHRKKSSDLRRRLKTVIAADEVTSPSGLRPRLPLSPRIGPRRSVGGRRRRGWQAAQVHRSPGSNQMRPGLMLMKLCLLSLDGRGPRSSKLHERHSARRVSAANWLGVDVIDLLLYAHLASVTRLLNQLPVSLRPGRPLSSTHLFRRLSHHLPLLIRHSHLYYI